LPDPGTVTHVVKRVRQTRDYLPDPVPEEALRDILDVARWTGSVSNGQPWTFIVVTDADTRERMAGFATNTQRNIAGPGHPDDGFDRLPGRIGRRTEVVTRRGPSFPRRTRPSGALRLNSMEGQVSG
jgi:nitroreductase